MQINIIWVMIHNNINMNMKIEINIVKKVQIVKVFKYHNHY